ncbi:MAG: hypothetical protein NXI08_16285 [bacterium]|nr:hypothetical protein [bacterium]
MNILILAEDLRISGTSEGIVSRSFIFKLREVYPHAIISVVHFNWSSEYDYLELLPVNNFKTIQIQQVGYRIASRPLIKVIRKLLALDLNDYLLIRQFNRFLLKINESQYDLIFARSAGLKYYLHRSLLNHPKLLSKSALNFHDPYPVYFSPGHSSNIKKADLKQLTKMIKIVNNAAFVFAPSSRLAENLSFLYGSKKEIYTIPHQFHIKSLPPLHDENAFHSDSLKKDEIRIVYHGAVQLNQNISILIDSFLNILRKRQFTSKIILSLRLKGNQANQLKTKYDKYKEIEFLSVVESAYSFYEQKYNSDICIILDTCGWNSEILVGKAPMLAELNKPVLALTPRVSELRKIIDDDRYLALCSSEDEIQLKLSGLINSVILKEKLPPPFGRYFSKEEFFNAINVLQTP